MLMRGNVIVKNRTVYTPVPQKTIEQAFQVNEAIQRGEYEAKIDHFEYRINDLNSNIDSRIELDNLKREKSEKTNKIELFLKILPIIISVISLGIAIYSVNKIS